MSDTSDTALGLSRTLLRLLIAINLATGAMLIGGFVASLVFEAAVADWLRRGLREVDVARLLPTLRVWVLLALPYAAAVHVMLSRTLEILGTVRLGRPFAHENAVRLKTIAWCLLLLQLLHLLFGVMVKIAAAANAHMDWSFSITGWLAVLLLFVLARVFEEGARMRDDLEAMI